MVPFKNDDHSKHQAKAKHHHITSEPATLWKAFKSIVKQVVKTNLFVTPPIDEVPSAELIEKVHKIEKKVQKLHHTADRVLAQLKTIKENLREEIDPELFSHVERVVDSRIKDILNIFNKCEQSENLIEKEKDFLKWVSKARSWVQLFSSQKHDRDLLIRAILKEAISDFERQILSSRKWVEDYAIHKINELHCSAAEKEIVAEKISARIEALRQPLNQLLQDLLQQSEDSTQKITLENLNLLKAEVELLRNEEANDSFHAIDEIFHEFAQDEFEIEDLDPEVIRNFKQIAVLEDTIPKVMQEVKSLWNTQEKNWDVEDYHKLHKLHATLVNLDGKAQTLEQDLNMTPEVDKRLQRMKKAIHVAQKLIEGD